MSWEAIATIAEVFGSVAVILTLFYLSLQVRQSNILARRMEENATTDQISKMRMAFVQDKAIAELFLKGSDDFHSLDQADQIHFDNLMNKYFWTFEQMWDRVKTKTLDQEIWDNTISIYVGYISSEGGGSWWKMRKETFPKDFVMKIESAKQK